MSIRALLVLLASILWFMFSTYWYCCKIQVNDCSFCPTATAPVTTKSDTPTITPSAKEKGPITFLWSDEVPKTTETFEGFKSAILDKKTADNILEITGYYTSEEENTSTFENMGLARANQTRALLSEDIQEERIRIKGILWDEKDGMRKEQFESLAFNWINSEINKTEVVELSDKVIILFPFNSSTKDENPTVDDYLDKLAARINTSKEKVEIIGHTDNVGDAERNQKLGRNRARQIRSILWSKGVKKSQIIIGSEGETNPVASNDTEQGRHQNRRVEVKILD